MTVLDILASTEIHSLARGCVFSYRLSHITLLHTQTHIVIHTNLSDNQQQLGWTHIQSILYYRRRGVVCSYVYP